MTPRLHPGDVDLALPPGRELTVTARDGARLAAHVAGHGPAVVLAHCWTGSRAVWAPVARRLVNAGHRVVLYDQRGHGASERGTEPCSVELLGHDLAAVVEQVDVHDAVLAGHSMGGMTVMGCAAVRPDLVASRARGLALVATGAFRLGSQGRRSLARAFLRGEALDRVVARPRLGSWMVRGTFGRSAHAAHVAATRDLFGALAADLRRGWLEAMAAMDLRPALARVETPTVVLVGTRDTLTPRRFARGIVAHVRDARLHELPGAGHMLPFERPVDVARAIRELAVG